jgi:hypothetical protein
LVALSSAAKTETVRLGAAKAVLDLALRPRDAVYDAFDGRGFGKLIGAVLDVALARMPEEDGYAFVREAREILIRGR